MIKIFFFLLLISSANAGTLQVVTSDFAPYQVMNGEKVEGLTTEIVNEVISGAGLTGNIRMYPWPRAYKIAQRDPDTIIYSIVRTPEREKLFKWIGAIAPYNVYLWKLKRRRAVDVNNIQEAKRYINGGVFDDIKATYLETIGFKRGFNLEYVGSDTLNIRKLFAGKIDLLPYDELSMSHKVKDAGYDFKKLKKLIRIDGISHDLYMAASLQVPDETVKKLICSLKKFKKTKKYKDIKARIK